MNIKNLVVLDYIKLKYLVKIVLAISLLYFFFLYLTSKIDLQNFILFLILFSIHCSLFYIYLSSKKELNYFPIYPLIIVYYFVTYTAFFYQNYELQAANRDKLKEYLSKNGIGTLIQWGGKAVHQFKELGFDVRLPVTENFFKDCIMIPMNCFISNDDVEYVCEKIQNFYRS